MWWSSYTSCDGDGDYVYNSAIVFAMHQNYYYWRTKHYEKKVDYIRDTIEKGYVLLDKVHTIRRTCWLSLHPLLSLSIVQRWLVIFENVVYGRSPRWQRCTSYEVISSFGELNDVDMFFYRYWLLIVCWRRLALCSSWWRLLCLVTQ